MILPLANINAENFEKACLAIFSYQASSNSVYKQYIDLIDVNPGEVKTLSAIPFLPISLFKTQSVICKNQEPEIIFTSSGTTGMEHSKHLVANLDLYRKSFITGFEHFYGKANNYCFLALLPNYLQREGSSLIYMMQELIAMSSYGSSGFYLNEFEKLSATLKHNQEKKIPTILLGVPYALLDLAEDFPQDLSTITIMETGGMKGFRKEITKEKLHLLLQEAFSQRVIHSEYGMTELLSQAYSSGRGEFKTPPWMSIQIRDPYDPFQLLPAGKTGGINIIDLANQESCSFIQTDDLGKLNANDSFQILGRLSASDLRGCNLLVQE